MDDLECYDCGRKDQRCDKCPTGKKAMAKADRKPRKKRLVLDLEMAFHEGAAMAAALLDQSLSHDEIVVLWEHSTAKEMAGGGL